MKHRVSTMRAFAKPLLIADTVYGDGRREEWTKDPAWRAKYANRKALFLVETLEQEAQVSFVTHFKLVAEMYDRELARDMARDAAHIARHRGNLKVVVDIIETVQKDHPGFLEKEKQKALMTMALQEKAWRKTKEKMELGRVEGLEFALERKDEV